MGVGVVSGESAAAARAAALRSLERASTDLGELAIHVRACAAAIRDGYTVDWIEARRLDRLRKAIAAATELMEG